MAGTCLACLHLPLKEFLDYTPIEVDFALKAYFENKDLEIRISWEQLRTQIYFSYLFTPSNKRKVSYSTFKKEFLPFSFDQDDKESKPVLDDEAIDAIQNFFKKSEKGTKN